jgi:uncharacterized protein with PQ loop repeat
LRWKRDLIYGVILTAFCISTIIYSFTIPVPPFAEGISAPDVYVRLCSCLMLILSISLIIKTLKTKNTEKVEPILYPMALFTIAAVAIYMVLMTSIGFMWSTFVFLLVTITVYGLYKKDIIQHKGKLARVLLKNAVFSLVITVAVQQIFVKLLKVILP